NATFFIFYRSDFLFYGAIFYNATFLLDAISINKKSQNLSISAFIINISQIFNSFKNLVIL
ncbi:MAG: hypothetical protein RR454_03545, partial [Clostridia bacterium]